MVTADSKISAAPATVNNGIYESELRSNRQYANPVADVDLTVEFTSPSGNTTSARAFWDGDAVWRVRFSPNEIGEWTWETKCSDQKNAMLHGQHDSFIYERYAGNDPLLIRGPLRLSNPPTTTPTFSSST